MADTTETNYDSIRVAVSTPYFSDHHIKLLDFYISAQKYEDATQQIQYLHQKFPKLVSYCDFKTLEINLLRSPMGLLSLKTDPAKKEAVLKVALDNNNLGRAQAQNILQLAIGNKTYEYTLLPPSKDSGNRFSQPNNNSSQPNLIQQLNNRDFNLVAIPNPAKNELVIKYKLPEPETNGTITLTDLTGRIMFKYDVINTGEAINVDANSLSNGIYLYNLQVKGTIIETKKLTIVK